MKTNRRDFLKSSAMSVAATGLLASSPLSAAEADELVTIKPIGGCVSVMVTTYREDHTPDLENMTRLCAYQAQAKADGVFVVGSTGDMPMLTPPERTAIVRAARKGLGSERTVIAGITDRTIETSINNAKALQDAGADVAVLMVPQSFFTLSQPEVIYWFTKIADASPLPILMYHHHLLPTWIEMDSIKVLAQHPNIIGMKETGKTIDRTLEILDTIAGENFALMQGREAYGAESYQRGGAGCLAALAGVWPEGFHQLDRAYRSKDEKAFKEAADKIETFCEVFYIPNRIDSTSYFSHMMKQMLMYRGWLDNDYVRMPNLLPDPEADAKLVKVLEKIGFPKKA